MSKKSSDELIYQATSWAIELKWDFDKETVWASLQQIANLFERDKSVISRHIKNIYKDWELNQKWFFEFFATTAIDGKTYNVEYFNLDMIISIWYRVNSKVATKFRQRATKTLKQHITTWYTINPKRLQYNYDTFMKSVEEVKKIVEKTALQSDDVLELIKFFGQTWFSLDAYDKGELSLRSQTQKTVRLQAKKLYDAIAKLKYELLIKWEATDFFAQEKYAWSLEWILGNVLQSAFSKDIYPSVESKASHLLYFVVKNHPFTDGNKRTGAFSFVWFLQMVWYDFRTKITPEALTSITLLIATSDPKDKQRVIELVMVLLQG